MLNTAKKKKNRKNEVSRKLLPGRKEYRKNTRVEVQHITFVQEKKKTYIPRPERTSISREECYRKYFAFASRGKNRGARWNT